MKGNFDASTGQGPQQYVYYAWKCLEKLQNEHLEIDKVELGFGKSHVLREVSFTLLCLIHNFKKYDVIHIPLPIMFNPPRRKDAKIVTTLHELVLVDKDSPYAKAMAGVPKQTVFHKVISNRIRKQIFDSDELIVNSTQTRDEAIALGYAKEHIHILRWGLDEQFLKKLSRPPETFTVGYLGALNVRKNVGFAIRAFKRIKDSRVRFEVYGRGSEYENLVRLAGDDRRIEMRGFAAEDRKADIYDSFSVFVFPSLYEGMCLPIIEAYSRGLPIVIYKRSIMPREIRKYCFEADDEEHMAQIIASIKEKGYDDEMRKKMAEYIKDYTWDNAARDTVEVYRKACRQ